MNDGKKKFLERVAETDKEKLGRNIFSLLRQLLERDGISHMPRLLLGLSESNEMEK